MATQVAEKRARSASNKSPAVTHDQGGLLTPDALLKLLELLKGATSVEL